MIINCPQSTLRVVDNITQSFGGPLLPSNHNNHWMYYDIHFASETKLSKLDSNFRVHMVPVGLTHNPKRKGMKFYSKKTPMLKSAA